MIRRTLRNLSTIAAICASGAAYAVGGSVDLSSGSTGFSSTPVAGAFSEVFTFTLLSSSVFSGSIASVVNGTQDVDFTSIVVSGPGGSFAFAQLGADPFEFWGLTPTVLTAGNYTLTLVGSNSASIGSYGGNLGATPVPEPQSMALMLGGVGALVFMMRRRRS